MSKNKRNHSGIVYSTDPDYRPPAEELPVTRSLTPGEQKIKVRLETKHRAGKAVTLVENFVGTEEDKIALGKNLKTYCGTGGSVKDGEILVQGDNRDKILTILQAAGYKAKKKGG